MATKRKPTAARKITEIVLHCSATRQGVDIGINTIRQWHLARGWRDVGYHYVIKLDGTIQNGRDISVAGSHVEGHNATTIGICYVGGLNEIGKPADTMTKAQETVFLKLVKQIRAEHSYLPVKGHNDYTNAKACPSFKVLKKWPDINTPSENGNTTI
jgi:N-acetylmuramoyl-L-alanine amidase